MRKIPTNFAPSPAKAELPLDLTGPHITAGASSAHRLYQALCDMIVSGLVKPSEPLPPSRTLAKQTGFRRNAVVTAYERLIADGFAAATVGSGTFVAARIPAGAEGWLLADTYSRARPLPGFVLGFSGHAVPQLVASAERLALESRGALRARSKSARRA